MAEILPEKNKGLEPSKWVERYSDYLFGFAMTRLRREDVAEDMVQETFLAAWNGRENFQSNASEKTWLTSILKNKIVDYYRKSSTRNELNILDKDESDGFVNHFFNKEGSHVGHWTDSSSPKNWKKDLHDPLEADEFRKILHDCLGKLPQRIRAVFVMKLIDDEESETICKELSITPSNYWILMHRAKLQLRECMEKNWAKI